jgi:two-component system, response regulator RegA
LSAKSSAQYFYEPLAARRLAVMDGDAPFFKALAKVFQPPEWELCLVTGGPTTDAQAFIVDACPNGVARIDLVAQIRNAVPDATIVAVTAYPSLDLAVEVTKAGASACFAKPVAPEEILRAISSRSSVRLSGDLELPSLARIEWDYIARVLSSAGGNISQAARTLGIQRSTLQRKLKKYPPVW